MIKNSRPPSYARVVAPLVFAMFSPCGCAAVTTLASLVPSLLYSAAESTLLDTFVQPTVAADAGLDQLVLTNQTAILNGSNSGVQSGSGTLQLRPDPPITYNWSIVTSPVTDQNNDGVVNAADLTAAGVRLANANTAFPQFSSPVAGVYVVQLNVSWLAPSGVTLTGSDFVQIGVAAPAQ